jgi:cytohesin
LTYIDEKGRSALHAAIYDNRYEFVKFLLDNGANPNEPFKIRSLRNTSGNSLFFTKEEFIKFQLNQGVNYQEGYTLSDTDEYDYPIFMAIRNGYTEIAQLLVEYGADLTLRNANGDAPLTYAAMCHSETEHGVFLTLGSNEEESEAGLEEEEVKEIQFIDFTDEQQDHGNDLPEDYFYKSNVIGNLELIELMIENGADINARGAMGQTALEYSIGLDSVKLMQLLIDNGADVNAEGNGERTALYRAVWNAANANEDIEKMAYLEIIRYLVSKGANVNIQGKDTGPPETLLITAVFAGDTETCELLIELGADVNAKTEFGMTALDYAKKMNHQSIVELLIQEGAI